MDFLITLTYRPRVLVYSLTSVILGSVLYYRGYSSWIAGLILYSLIFPHLVRWLAPHLAGRRAAILKLQYLDALHVGIYCAAVEFDPMASISFVSALTLSNLILSGRRAILCSLLWLVAGSVSVGFLTGFRFVPDHGILTTVLAGTSILLYSGLIGCLGYSQISHLVNGHSRIRSSHDHLTGVADNLRKYIAPQIYSSLLSENREVVVRTNRKRLVIFFSDIEGFTELTDHMEAEALTSLLNRYLQEMSEIALAHGGTIDKFMGDGIMIFFGDPISRGPRADALACTRMALAMKSRMQTLRANWDAEGVSTPLHVRIGINTGYCTVGNFGCDARLDYTIIGSAVNLASRLETSAGRDEIVISQETHALVRQQIDCTARSGLKIKGFSRPVDVYLVNGERREPAGLFERQNGGLWLKLDPAQLDPARAVDCLQEALDEIHRMQMSEVHAPNAGVGPGQSPGEGAILRVFR